MLWSEKSIASEWVRSEASEARRRGILVPAFIEAVNPPLAFRLLQGADLTTWTPGAPSEEFENLTRRVAELVGPSTQISGTHRPQGWSPGDHRPARRPRSWWAGAAAAVSLLLVAGALLVGVYRGKATSSTSPAEGFGWAWHFSRDPD